MKLTFRPATTDERRCLCPGRPEDSPGCSPIVSLWSATYKDSDFGGLIWHDDWADIMHRQITKIIANQNRTAIIALAHDDPTFFYGFIVGDMTGNVPVVDYVAVKEPYRKQGIARALFAELGVSTSERFVYSCRNWFASKLSSKVPLARLDREQAIYPKKTRRRHL
jgi:GNAT superfamily N-acetyltransferase